MSGVVGILVGVLVVAASYLIVIEVTASAGLAFLVALVVLILLLWKFGNLDTNL